MKQETNNEMDLLLRKLGREGDAAPMGGGNGTSGLPLDEHLDADELNSYAENSLPPAARLRYTEHLADCTQCRTLVSQLSLAAGLVVQEKAVPVPAPSAIKAFLSSFFTPMVLRYAVPALALIAVASIGLMMFRQSTSRETKRSAETESYSQKQDAPVSPGIATESSNNRAKPDASQNEVAKNKVGEQVAGAKKLSQAPADDSRQEPTEAKKGQPATTTDQVAAAAPATSPVSSNTAVATAKPAVEEQKAQQAVDVADRKSQPSAAAAPQKTEVAKSNENEKAAAKAPPREPGRTFGGVSGIRSGPAKAKAGTSNEQAQSTERDAESRRERADKDEPETRSVAGRRFRKEGQVWIDVAYESSRETVNVARGSEQYRALVADEPAIKTIADQLPGEVIVVWKNRAYRIR